ncbi:M20/M25/M40 family metallo-hydrolase [Acetohalobium arabaticum]|uniref:Peptidase M20 n=1 Tax=Acetohalobium arabaticum (strain ATCC 49924 / DSM 5501 / Z-7288) TaxID=574087 RepID=D9QV01_ACEAZ|nr:M20/M25/M40 family metallo-hydrolase [Acetohalobium arabaticum]ADL12060.1 peptidase M20 [Acetohalobium arabaticum DSM 5501]
MDFKEEILQFIDSNLDRFIEESIKIQQIPAPTFHEENRADYIRNRLESFARGKVQIDKVGNVIKTYTVDEDLPTVMIAAHLDTVFSKEVDLEVKREGNEIYGPGLCDNSLSLEGLVMIAEIMDKFELELNYNLILTSTVGEEGRGNLKGMQQVMEDYQDKIDTVIVLEGDGLGRITHQAVGSSRWKVEFSAKGGHSWGDFGNSSAVHTMSKIISALSDFELPTEPKTTFNVGKVAGGRAVNAIASKAEMLLEVRSVGEEALAEVSQEFKKIIQEVCRQNGVEVGFENIGKRPAGGLNKEHQLVKLLKRIHQRLDLSSSFKPGSTDGNLPLNLGIPAVTIGLTKGVNLHSTDEYIEVKPLKKGLQQLILIVLQIEDYIKS